MGTALIAAVGDVCPIERNRHAPRETRAVQQGYQLPHDVMDRLKAALAGYKNRDAAMALAVFLARFWSSRARMARTYPIDRRALATHEALGLTEARIRGAIKTLEEIGFLHRGIAPPGSVHKLTAAGELHRKPILFGFGREFGPLFAAANARAERARLRRQGRAVQGNPTVVALRASRAARMPLSEFSGPKIFSPKDKIPTGGVVIMGEVAIGSSDEPGVDRSLPSSDLEAALARLCAAWSNRSNSV